jgi:uncharacterized membrane-anchored protein YitT (DUF2179 family)
MPNSIVLRNFLIKLNKSYVLSWFEGPFLFNSPLYMFSSLKISKMLMIYDTERGTSSVELK